MQVDPQSAPALLTTWEIKAIAICWWLHPGHREIWILPDNLVIVIGITIIFNDISSTRCTDLSGITQLQCPDRQVSDMWCHAGCPAATEIHPETMIECIFYQIWIEGLHPCGTHPHIPVHSSGCFLCIISKSNSIWSFIHHKKCSHSADIS